MRGAPQGFRVQCRVYHLGSAVLADVRSSSLRCQRSARHVALGAYDHYQVTLGLSGEIHYRSGRQSAIVRAGDIVVLDSTRETAARVHAADQSPAHALTLFVPRAALARLHRAPRSGHLLLLRRESATARSAHDRLSQILQTIEHGPQAELQAAAQALIGWLAGNIGRRKRVPPVQHRVPHTAAADSLERLIERRLDSPTLSLRLLCSHCGCSRATVYRLLEADGGPVRYIRQRRMQRAFLELISAGASDRTLLEVARRHRFASEATFNRAFSRTFGITPGKVREIAARSRRAALAGPGSGCTQALGWIRTLGRGASDRPPSS